MNEPLADGAREQPAAGGPVLADDDCPVSDPRYFIARWPCCRLLKDARATVMIPVDAAEIRAWELCDGRHTVRRILERVGREHEDAASLPRLADFLQDLATRGMIRVAGAADAGGGPG